MSHAQALRLAVLFFLATTSLVLGTSHSNAQIHDVEPLSKAQPVAITIFLMSKCSDWYDFARDVFDDTFAYTADIVRVNYEFIAHAKNGGFESMHGPLEVEGDIHLACVQEHYPDELYDYTHCLNTNFNEIPYNSKDCAELVGFDWSVIDACTSGREGDMLLSQSINRVDGIKVTWSPTIFLNDHFYCKWADDKNPCPGNFEGLVEAICDNYEGHAQVCGTDKEDDDSHEDHQEDHHEDHHHDSSKEKDCCQQHDTPYCKDHSIEMCVCQKDAFCCNPNGKWDSTCVALAKQCGGCHENDIVPPTHATECCQAKRDSGCPRDSALETCVCAKDDFCCGANGHWDEGCVFYAAKCGGCEWQGSDESCCEVRDTPGCKTKSTRDCVCKKDSYCCYPFGHWDDHCVGLAKQCGDCGGAPHDDDHHDDHHEEEHEDHHHDEETEEFPCCREHRAPGCSFDKAVEQCVCKKDFYCCDHDGAWDASCVDFAHTCNGCPATF